VWWEDPGGYIASRSLMSSWPEATPLINAERSRKIALRQYSRPFVVRLRHGYSRFIAPFINAERSRVRSHCTVQ
jgi:hypothetical protein